MGIIRRYIESLKGVIAVEFALVALPFIMLMIGTLEMAVMFTSQALVEGATANASRLIRTGQVQESGNPQATFETAVCDVVQALINCNDLQYQVFSVDSFEDVEALPDADLNDEGVLQGQTFNPGNENDVVLVRVVYLYKIKTPMFQALLSNRGNDERAMMATTVLQAEPYDWDGT